MIEGIPIKLAKVNNTKNVSIKVTIDGVNVTIPEELEEGTLHYLLAKEKNWLCALYEKEILKGILLDEIKEIASKACNKLNISYSKIEIKDPMDDDCFGYCNSEEKELHFNVKLIYIPRLILEQVVLEEVCHLLIDDHSEAFFKLLASIGGNHKLFRSWADENEYKFMDRPSELYFMLENKKVYNLEYLN